MEGGILSQFKFIIFFTFVLTAVPFGIMMARKSVIAEKAIFFLLIFFTMQEVTVNFVSRETFRITTRGFEIGMVDCLAIIIAFLIKGRKQIFPVKKPDGGSIFIIYIFFSFLSIVNAESYLFSAFELSKMVRMYFFLWVVYNYINSREQFIDIMNNISVIIIFIFFSVLKQKYLEGRFQTPGPFPHQNSLVMYMILFNSLVFSYLLNNKRSSLLYWLSVFGMGSIVIVSTLSRAGMAVFVLSCSIILVVSLTADFSLRKIMVFTVSLVVGSAILIKAADTIAERFRTAPEESADVRVMLAEAAVKMANDKVLGVGLNNFGIKINPPYKYGDHIEHKEGGEDVKNGLVETVYLMIAAETGWHNLAVFAFWLLYMLFLNLKNMLFFRRDMLFFIPVGITGGLIAIYLESSLEWVLKQTHNFFQLMLIFAIIGAVIKIKERERNGQQSV